MYLVDFKMLNFTKIMAEFQPEKNCGLIHPYFQENTEEDLWTLWGKIINEWETWSKKKQPQLKVNFCQEF